MKKEDIILAILTSEGIGALFYWIEKKSNLSIPFDIFLFFIFLPIFALVVLEICFLIGKKFIFVWQLAKFALVGGFFAFVDLVIFNSLMAYFKIEKGILATFFVALSFCLATTLKYIFDKLWVFEKKEREGISKEFSLFFIVTLISGGIQVGVADFIINRTRFFSFLPSLVVANLGKILGIISASVWNFLGYKFLVFKK